MPRHTRRNFHWHFFASIWLLTVGLLMLSSAYVHAQYDPTIKPEDVMELRDEEAEGMAEKEAIPFVLSLDEAIESFAEPSEAEALDAQARFEHALLLPNLHMGNLAESSATNATWRVVLNETFEGEFPSGAWSIRDYNGPSVGTKVAQYATLVWDDTSTKAYQGNWSVHPNDWTSYANHTDTWMRYGPMNLTGSTNVRVSFYYWLDTETYYDIVSWSISCNILSTYTTGYQRSGPTRQWVRVSYEVPSCANKSAVYLKFEFKSDYSNPSSPAPTGVWIDNIKVEKYQ